MANRYDIVSPREGSNGKTYYTKIGTMWPAKNGGFSLTFDALPIPGLNRDGKLEVRVLAFEPRDDARPAQRAPAHDDLNDDVPF
jgi:hypothetical protein